MRRTILTLALVGALAAPAGAATPGAAWQCFGSAMLPAMDTFELGIVVPDSHTPSLTLVFGPSSSAPAESVMYDGRFLSFGYRGRVGWLLAGALETATHRLSLALQNIDTGALTRFEGDCLPLAGTRARP